MTIRIATTGAVIASALLMGGCAATDLNSMLGGTPPDLAATDAASSPAPSQRAATAPVMPQRQPTVAEPKAALADAEALKRAGRPAEAHALLVKAHAEHPDARDVQLALGLSELDQGNPNGAESHLAKVVKAAPSDWRALSGLGVAASMLGRQGEAQGHLRKALAASPNNAAVLNNLAVSYMLERKPAEAEKVLRRATSTGKASRDTLDNLALARALKAQVGADSEE
jgi:Flp pilus assembly protein TadD